MSSMLSSVQNPTGIAAVCNTTNGSPSARPVTPCCSECRTRYRFVDLFFVQDAGGDQVMRSRGLIGRRGDRWWYRQFIEGGAAPFISKSYYSLTGDKPVASAFHPILAEARLVGIMGNTVRGRSRWTGTRA
jgi:hypothetical protein